MSVSKRNGKFICFNASCAATGTMQELIKAIKQTNEFQTARLIAKARTESVESTVEKYQKAFAPAEFEEWKYAHTIPIMEELLFSDERALKYMTEERGFDETILREYHIGYNNKRDLICVPMYNTRGMCLGVIGRSPSHTDKIFKNSPGLPTSKSLWNIQKAKRTGETVIICEASFDAMRIAQAGYPNVVACLGGNFSEYHAEQLKMHFNTIIIMTDNDDVNLHRQPNCRKCGTTNKNDCNGHNPGRALGRKIADTMSGKSIKWASYESGLIYPHDAKDAGDMSIIEIRQCIKNAVTNLEYSSWNLAA